MMKRSLSEVLLGDTGMIGGARLCFKADAILPALVLAYSFVDQCSFLAFGDADGKRGQTFQEWLDTYMAEDLRLMGVKSIEIWSARCSVLHDAGFESKSTQAGKARWFSYYWGEANRFPDEVINQSSASGKTVQVNVGRLLASIEEAAKEFVKAIQSDPLLEHAVEERLLTRRYSHIPAPELWQEVADFSASQNGAKPNRAARRRAAGAKGKS